MERIGVFGGSFDPVHLGHLLVAQAAREELELERLFFNMIKIMAKVRLCRQDSIFLKNRKTKLKRKTKVRIFMSKNWPTIPKPKTKKPKIPNKKAKSTI